MCHSESKQSSNIGILILSGGQGRRMGGQDKGWIEYQGLPMIQKLLQTLDKQSTQLKLSAQIVISANRNIAAYQQLGHLVLADDRNGFQGPLAGIETALSHPGLTDIERWIICPVDSPELPTDYLQIMSNLDPNQIAFLQDAQRSHFAHLSLPATKAKSLSKYLNSGKRSIKGYLSSCEDVTAVESSISGFSLRNCNTEQEIKPRFNNTCPARVKTLFSI